MKTLDLNAYGVSEMSHQEMVETDGGSLLVIGVVLLVAVVASSCATSREYIKVVDNMTKAEGQTFTDTTTKK